MLYLLIGLIARGAIDITDMRRNIERLSGRDREFLLPEYIHKKEKIVLISLSISKTLDT